MSDGIAFTWQRGRCEIIEATALTRDEALKQVPELDTPEDLLIQEADGFASCRLKGPRFGVWVELRRSSSGAAQGRGFEGSGMKSRRLRVECKGLAGSTRGARVKLLMRDTGDLDREECRLS
jgi:hypothetical protein